MTARVNDTMLIPVVPASPRRTFVCVLLMVLLIIPTYFKVLKAISIKALTVPCFSHTNDVWPLKSNKALELIKFGHSSIHMQFCNFPLLPL